jgi:hypothetical protein
MVFGLFLIWFPDLGDVRGWVGRGGYIDTDSPPFLISFAGWIFLRNATGVVLHLVEFGNSVVFKDDARHHTHELSHFAVGGCG